VPGLTPKSTNPNGRAHYFQKHADGKAYGETVYLIASGYTRWKLGHPWERAHVTLTQKAVKLRDGDNFLASFKPGLDAIVRAGILVDDKPSCVEIITVQHEKVAHKADECVEVLIERL